MTLLSSTILHSHAFVFVSSFCFVVVVASCVQFTYMDLFTFDL